MKIFLFLIAILLATTSVMAQELPGAAKVSTGQPATLSFEQAIRLAIENNLATLRAEERRNEARGLQQQSAHRYYQTFPVLPTRQT